MKTLSLLLSMCWASLAFGQGTTCSNATIITVDGIARSFPVSTSQGACGFCTMSGYSGNNGRITYFRFTTDNQPQCVLIDVTASTSITMEMMLYDVCNSGVASPAGGLYNHNMCMNEGLGIWAQNLFDNLSPNTTYYLKVRTEGGYTGNIQVSAKYHTPSNLICNGATSISSSASVSDNNACHIPGTVPPTQLCAITLENTAWYTYVVQSSGSSTVTIDNIVCNNGNGNSSNGFQIGFFSGDCGALVPITCSSGSGGTVTATATGLSGGTRIYVAIDGYSGSNCSYTINASNAHPMPVTLKKFLAWNENSQNKLHWVTIQENQNNYFEIQRSENGRIYYPIGRLPGEISSDTEKDYFFTDNNPMVQSYYRLKQVDLDGKFSYSKVVEVNRPLNGESQLIISDAGNNVLQYKVISTKSVNARMNLYSAGGMLVYTTPIRLNKGSNSFQKETEKLTKGYYILEISTETGKTVAKFLKQ